jgi:hypothetical protein
MSSPTRHGPPGKGGPVDNLQPGRNRHREVSTPAALEFADRFGLRHQDMAGLEVRRADDGNWLIRLRGSRRAA